MGLEKLRDEPEVFFKVEEKGKMTGIKDKLANEVLKREDSDPHTFNLPSELYQSKAIRKANYEGYKKCLKDIDTLIL